MRGLGGRGVVPAHEIDAALSRIRSYVRETPVIRPGRGAFGLDSDIVLKLECLQHTGSFKPRGAFNRVLSSDVPDAGLIAASGGNHGQAVAYVGGRLGHRAEIFVPEISAKVKRDRIAAYGATVHVVGSVYSEAQAACNERAAQTGALMVHPYDSPATIAGQATVGRELQSQAPGIDTIIVAVGGGGLSAGVAAAYDGTVKIVTVEPETSRCLGTALAAGEPVDVTVSGVAADSLGSSRVGSIPWEILSRLVDESVTVPDSDIMAARQLLWDELRVVTEPGGATALAALTSAAYSPQPEERVAVIVCGANTDPGDLT